MSGEPIDLPEHDEAITNLPADARAVLGRLWAARAAQEQGAAVVMSRVSAFVAEACPVPELVLLAARAPHDEMRHADLCRRVAARYSGGEPAWPSPPVAPPDFAPAPRALWGALFVVAATAINEGIGAAFLQACHDNAVAAVPRAATRALLRDEVDHGRIGWAYLAAIGPERRQALRPHMPMLIEQVRETWSIRMTLLPSEVPPGHGCIDAATLRGVIATALDDLVARGLRELDLEMRDD